MHTGAMWPIRGKYICPQCLREYPVQWGGLAGPAGQPNAGLRKAELSIATHATAVQ